MSIKIAASLLSADFSRLGEEVKTLDEAGADLIHLDVMDSMFVPNLTIGPSIVKSIRSLTKLPFDVHLMVSDPASLIDKFVDCGADIITVHVEAVTHIDRIIDQIKAHGIKAGASLVPSTDESTLNYLYEKIDMILVMTVNPGFGGQQFITSQLEKIKNIRSKIDQIDPLIDLSIDGGINDVTAKLAIQSGANMLVSGSYVFNGDYKENIYKLRG